MKNYLFISIACSLLLCCQHEPNEPIIPEEPEPEAPYVMPCGCGVEWPQEEITCDRVLPWDYPAKPGTEEWNNLEGHQERINTCQIPEEILTSLSTEDLTKICLQYPFLLDFYLYNSYELGLDALFRQFNGIRELFTREDVSNALLKEYRRLLQSQRLYFLNGTAPDGEKGLYIISTWYPEILLSRYQSPNDAKENYIEIVHQLVCGYEKKLMYPEFSKMHTNFYARAIMLVKIDQQNIQSIPFGYANCVFEHGRYDDPTEQAINDLSCQYLNR